MIVQCICCIFVRGMVIYIAIPYGYRKCAEKSEKNKL